MTENAQQNASLADDLELLGDFVVESREHLSAIEQQLLRLENDPANAEALHAIFRGFHTIKGLAGFLDIGPVQQVAHEVETVLDRARNGQLAMTPAVVDQILLSKDYLAAWMSAVERRVETGVAPEMPSNEGLLTAIQLIGTETATAGLDQLAQAVQADAAPSEAKASEAKSESQAESRLIKVDTGKLDTLVDLMGELVIAQTLVQHDQDLGLHSKPKLARNLAQLARITEEVQKTTLSMRMVPVGRMFHKMVRLVRDLGKRSGKQVELELIGEDTELDRHMVDELSDPLMHMVRNSVDHGIEVPDERVKAGKPPAARITLRAFHQAGSVVIAASDDGRGLDREKILKKARKNGLVSENAELTDQEVFGLIFQPGFSTAEKVTDVSGRGVGMDVVRKHVQKLRGRIDIESELGKGTTFLLKVPLTLAIIDGLIASVGSDRYIVPMHGVREMLRASEDGVFTVQGKSEMVMVRGELLPVVRLHERFQVEPRAANLWEGLLIVAESNEKKFALLVDELAGKQEVVIKSLGPSLQGIRGVAGGAILGDGCVGLILDLEGLAR